MSRKHSNENISRSEELVLGLEMVSKRIERVPGWSTDREGVREALASARNLRECLVDGDPIEDIIPIVEELSERLRESPTLWLSSLGGDGSTEYDQYQDARRAFYTMRADLFPDGRPVDR